MLGQDYAIDEVKIPHPRYKMLANQDCDKLGRKYGEWTDAIAHIGSCDNVVAGVSEMFGRVLADSLPNVTVGIVQVAMGGASIKVFDEEQYEEGLKIFSDNQLEGAKRLEPNGNLYKALLDLAKIAQKDGVIKGIIMHQGEADSGSEWKYMVKSVRDKLLGDLGLSADSVPFIAGELVRKSSASRMKRIIQVDSLPYIMENTYVVSSLGCESKSDSLHFSSEGYAEMGRRYAQLMLQHISYDRSDAHINDTVNDDFVTISPNPTSRYLLVTIRSKGKAELYSVSGVRITEVELQKGCNTIDLNNISNGMYLMRVRCGDDVVVKKVIKR